ncbi:hypothetical protein [Nocardiopsis salina]|uniref:hypothetical protein n=1 Tax=Nocardiopsis salina TaxID=245836 RepID=UPI00034A8D45|nr:hypothetical protein [Nocardiopsis salina]
MSDPAGIAIVTALATGAVQKISETATDNTIASFKDLCKRVFARFRETPGAQEALDEARVESDDPAALEKVAVHLQVAEQEDPEIARLVAELRRAAEAGSGGSVTNTINGNVSGNAKVVQTQDINGDVRL